MQCLVPVAPDSSSYRVWFFILLDPGHGHTPRQTQHRRQIPRIRLQPRNRHTHRRRPHRPRLQRTTPKVWMTERFKYQMEHYASICKITPLVLAKKLGLTDVRLCQLTRKYYNCTPQELIANVNSTSWTPSRYTK